jgi:hypothetical protein
MKKRETKCMCLSTVLNGTNYNIKICNQCYNIIVYQIEQNDACLFVIPFRTPSRGVQGRVVAEMCLLDTSSSSLPLV